MTWLTRRDQYHQRSPLDAWKFGFFQLAYRTDIKGQLGESMAGGEGTGRGGVGRGQGYRGGRNQVVIRWTPILFI